MTFVAALRSWQVQLLVLTFVWGSNFALIEVAIRDFTPAQIAMSRMLLGGVSLGLVAWMVGARMPTDRRTWYHLTVAGALAGAIPCTLVPLAQQELTSVVAGICNASAPLFALLTAALLLGSRRGGADTYRPDLAIPGMLIGFAGVVIIYRASIGAGGSFTGYAFALAAAASHGVAATYIRRFLSTTPLTGVVLATGQITTSTMLLVPFAVRDGIPDQVHLGPALAVLSLGVVSSGVAYALYHAIIREAGPTTGASVMYLMPLVSTSVGVVALGEAVTLTMMLGAAFLVGGVVWSARSTAIPAPRATT